MLSVRRALFYPVATLGLAATLAGCVYEAPGYAYNPYEPAVATPQPPAYYGMYGYYRPYSYYHPYSYYPSDTSDNGG